MAMCGACQAAWNALLSQLNSLNNAKSAVENAISGSGCKDGNGLRGTIENFKDLVISGAPIDKGVMQECLDELNSVADDLALQIIEIRNKMTQYNNCTHLDPVDDMWKRHS